MRSSPNCSAVSRSEDDAPNTNGHRRFEDEKGTGIEVTVKVSYKTLTAIFALFSILGRIFSSLADDGFSSVSEKLSGVVPFF